MAWMAMPPEHLQDPIADEKTDTNMLGLSMMQTSGPAQPITSTNGGSEYVVNSSGSHPTNSNNGSYHHNHTSSMNSDGNDQSTEEKYSENTGTTGSHSNPLSNGSHRKPLSSEDYDESKDNSNITRIHPPNLASMATKQNPSGLYYPTRPSREAVLQRLSNTMRSAEKSTGKIWQREAYHEDLH